MKIRLAATTAVIGALVLSMSGAQAATPVLDGKKVKVLTFKASPVTQDNDKDGAALTAPDYYAECDPAKCGKVAFTYKPAKGAKTGLLFSIAWTNRLSDFDLYAVEVDKRGNSTEMGRCAGFGQLQEKFYLPSSMLKSGHTYAMVVNYFRSVSDTVTGKVEIGVPNPIPTTVPDKVDTLEHLNCSL